MCLALRYNTVMPVRLKPAAAQSQVKHSTTEPLCSLCAASWQTNKVAYVSSEDLDLGGCRLLMHISLRVLRGGGVHQFGTSLYLPSTAVMHFTLFLTSTL